MLTLLLLAFTFLILPTNLPVNFDGIPLDTRPEIASLMVVASISLWMLLRWTFQIPVLKPKNDLAGRVATVLLACAIAVKFFFSPSQSITSCATIIGISPTTETCINKTVPTLDNVSLGNGSGLTPFPLGGINSLSFNHHYCDPVKDPVCKGLQSTRMDQGYPFNLRLDIPNGYFANTAPRELRIKYRGAINIQSGSDNISLPFAEDSRIESVKFPADAAFTIRFRNYSCLISGANWADCEGKWNFSRILPFQQARLQVLNARTVAPHGVSTGGIIAETLALAGLFLALTQWMLPQVSILQWLRTTVASRRRIYLAEIGLVGIVTLVFAAIKGFDLSGNMTTLLFTAIAAWVIAPTLSSIEGSTDFSNIRRTTDRSLLAFFVLGAAVIVTKIPLTDFLIPLSTGDDQLTYSSWSRDLTASGVMTADSSIVLSKPFFLVLYAMLNRLFGDLNGFNMNFQTWSCMSISLVSLVIFTAKARSINAANSKVTSVLNGALAVFFMTWLTGSTINAFRGVQYLSEMCLWFVALPTVAALCAELSTSTDNASKSNFPNTQWVAAIGAGLMIAMRTQSIAVITTIGITAFIISGKKALPLATKCAVTTLISLGIIAARFASTPTTLDAVRAYARANTIHDVPFTVKFLDGWTDTIYDSALVWILAILTITGAVIASRSKRRFAFLVGPITIILLYVAQNPLKVTGVRQLYLNGWATAFLAAALLPVALRTGKPRVPGRTEDMP